MERILARCVVGASVCSALVGAMVLVGWYARVPILTRVGPSFVAMQYNTAVAFLLAAGALTALRRGHARIAVACASGVLVLGGLTLLEHLTGASFGIDQLLWRLGVSRGAMGELANVRQSAPGRMAPNTTLSFTLLGGAMLALASGSTRHWRVIVSAALALCASALGIVAFSGYLIGIPTAYGWGNLTRMALPTAFGVSLLGLGTAAAAMLAGVRADRSTREWLPGLTGLAVAVSTLMMWQALVDHDRRDVEDAIAQRARLMSNELSRRIEERGQLLTRLAARESHDGSAQRASLADGAPRTLLDYPGLTDLAIIDAEGVVQWTSRATPRARLGTPIVGDAGRAGALAAARSAHRASASGIVAIDSLRRGVYLVAPVMNGDSVTGYVASNLWVAALAEDVLRSDLTDGDSYVLRDGASVLHAHRPAVESAPEAWATSVETYALDRTLTLSVSPRRRRSTEPVRACPSPFSWEGSSPR